MGNDIILNGHPLPAFVLIANSRYPSSEAAVLIVALIANSRYPSSEAAVLIVALIANNAHPSVVEYAVFPAES
jgi:hypothetical protein